MATAAQVKTLRQINAVDPMAAAVFLGMLLDDELKSPFSGDRLVHNCGNSLSTFFVWGDTPQGHVYWSELNNKLFRWG